MNNKEKRDKYALLMSKLKKATDYEYYYEAIFIEYAILEDRFESLLKHAGLKYKKDNGTNINLESKIKKIETNKIFQDKYVKKHINDILINNIRNWKNSRNKMIHDLVNIKYDDEKIKAIALEGECIVKRFASKTTLVNKHIDKSKNNINYKK